MKDTKMKGKKTSKVGIILIVLVIAYMGMALFFRTHFCFGTNINGIDVSGLGVVKAEELIREEVASYSLTLLPREQESETILGADIELTAVFNGQIEALLQEQNAFAWIAEIFSQTELEMEQFIVYNEELLEREISGLSCMEADNQRKPVDATFSEYSKEQGYVVVPADYGTTIDKERMLSATAAAIELMETELDMDINGCYVEPDVKDDDAGLTALLAELNRYVGTVVTYEIGDEREVLDAEIISTWLGAEDGKITVDDELLREFVRGLGRTYNTAYRPKEFTTSYGETITITEGFYGWRINGQAEVEQLYAELEAGEAVTREPIYEQTANSHGEHDYGDSYVEINLTAQHLFLYKDGKLIIETDFVSGDVADGNSTPTGAFALTYKTQDAVLRGEDYVTPVTYWMPFNGDVGMHDATWRSSYGKNIYKTNGSHGCINLPFSAAKKIYETIDKGYCVFVYNLPGTEAVDVQQDAAYIVGLIDSIGEVTVASEPVIESARNLYNALPNSAKGYVTNIDVLVAAEATLAQIKAGVVQPQAAGAPTDQTVSADQAVSEIPGQ